MSHIKSTPMCMLICNIHWCRLAIQSTSISVQCFSETLATNFGLLFLSSKFWNSCVWGYYVPHSHARCYNIQHHTMIRHHCSSSSLHCSNAVYRNFMCHTVMPDVTTYSTIQLSNTTAAVHHYTVVMLYTVTLCATQ
jgi:hypothetical protein